jgi:hypothetical protein
MATIRVILKGQTSYGSPITRSYRIQVEGIGFEAHLSATQEAERIFRTAGCIPFASTATVL